MIFDLWFILVAGIVAGTMAYILWLTEVRDILHKHEDEWGQDIPATRVAPPVGAYPQSHVETPTPYDWRDAR